jgi:hypothetical protein
MHEKLVSGVRVSLGFGAILHNSPGRSCQHAHAFDCIPEAESATHKYPSARQRRLVGLTKRGRRCVQVLGAADEQTINIHTNAHNSIVSLCHTDPQRRCGDGWPHVFSFLQIVSKSAVNRLPLAVGCNLQFVCLAIWFGRKMRADKARTYYHLGRMLPIDFDCCHTLCCAKTELHIDWGHRIRCRRPIRLGIAIDNVLNIVLRAR